MCMPLGVVLAPLEKFQNPAQRGELASDAPDGNSFFNWCSTGRNPTGKFRHGQSTLTVTVEIAVVVSLANLLTCDIFPDSNPDTSGTRAKNPHLSRNDFN